MKPELKYTSNRNSNRNKAIKQQCPVCGRFRVKKESQAIQCAPGPNDFKPILIWWCEYCQLGDECA